MKTNAAIVPTATVTIAPKEAFGMIVTDAAKSTAALQKAVLKGIKDQNTLEAVTDGLALATTNQDRISEFLDMARQRVSEAFLGFLPETDSSTQIVVSIKNWMPMRVLETAIKAGKDARAKFHQKVEEERVEKQRQLDLEQAKLNAKEAEKAVKDVKADGADRQTQQAVKEAVLSRPAPVVESKVQPTASLRFNYAAQLDSMRELFLAAPIAPHIMGVLTGNPRVKEAIEAAFRPMAQATKEAFVIPGMSLKKTPVDVAR